MSRHEMDLEKAISHDQAKAKALSILMTDVHSECTESTPNPMNSIKELLRDVEQGKIKKLVSSEESDTSSDDNHSPPTCLTFKEYLKKTKEDLQDMPVVDVMQSECPECAKSTVECYYHSRRTKDSAKDGRNIQQNSNKTGECDIKKKRKNKKHKKRSQAKSARTATKPSEIECAEPKPTTLEPIPLDVIEKYRITVDEIRQLERFKDYSPGRPSKVRPTFWPRGKAET